MNAFRLDGEVALITGGGTGLGLAAARCMAEIGAQVVLAGRRESVLRQAAATIGPAAHFEVHDVTDFEAAPALVRRVEERFGKLTILVNNAGNHLKKLAMETTEREMQEVLNTHLLGAQALTRAAAPGMVARQHGSIVYIASMASLIGLPYLVAYAAAKSAVVGVVRTLATELSGHGVRVNAVAPGWIRTEMVAPVFAADPQRERRVVDRTPMGRLGEPAEIGSAITYLCTPAASFITGAVLPVDGGASIGF